MQMRKISPLPHLLRRPFPWAILKSICFAARQVLSYHRALLPGAQLRGLQKCRLGTFKTTFFWHIKLRIFCCYPLTLHLIISICNLKALYNQLQVLTSMVNPTHKNPFLVFIICYLFCFLSNCSCYCCCFCNCAMSSKKIVSLLG